jgi:hypothetical protein
VGSGVDRRLHGRLPPLRERPDRGDQHIAPLDERPHALRPFDVGHERVEAAQLVGQLLEPLRVAPGQDRAQPALRHRPRGQAAGVARGAEEDDPPGHRR